MTTAGPTRYYRLIGHDNARVGFISPHSHNFCESCNRVRVTAEGRLLLCLGQEHSILLFEILAGRCCLFLLPKITHGSCLVQEEGRIVGILLREGGLGILQ